MCIRMHERTVEKPIDNCQAISKVCCIKSECINFNSNIAVITDVLLLIGGTVLAAVDAIAIAVRSMRFGLISRGGQTLSANNFR